MSKYDRKTCKDCGGRDEVIDGICNDCSEHYEYCSVCKEHQHTDSLCRHLFWTECGYAGAGACNGEQDFKEEVWAFLGWLESLDVDQTFWGKQFCPELHQDQSIVEAVRETIADGRFSTFLCGPMLGCPTVQLYRWTGDEPGNTDKGSRAATLIYTYGGSLEDRDDSEAAGDGFAWLQSLFCRYAPEANALTVKWIDEWLANKTATKLETQAS